jgi:hypothetical protein
MKKDSRDFVSRLATAGSFVAIGVCICWRAYTFADPLDPTIIAPVLCIVLGLLLVMTGIIVALRGGDFDADLGDAYSEEPPAQPN